MNILEQSANQYYSTSPNTNQNIPARSTSVPSNVPRIQNLSPSFPPNNNNSTSISITNQLQLYLSQQEEQSVNNSTNLSSNFYTITQYILQSYFKVDVESLPSLRLVDLIVDQTYPDSLTLRKLNDGSSFQSYEYFNTVSRDPDLSRCPIFSLAVYFVIRWSHPNPPITLNNYNTIRLLEQDLISFDLNPAVYIQNTLNATTNSSIKVPRSGNFNPSNDLISSVFPWLPSFRQDVLLHDRTNYNLHSLCELFEFMGRIIIQDLKYLNEHALLLPNIVKFICQFIPDLFQRDEFKGVQVTDKIDNNAINPITNNMKIANDTSNVNQNTGNDSYPFAEKVESHFLELSKKLTTENIRLSQQITQLKGDMNSLTSVCSQILQLQRQLLSGSIPDTSLLNTITHSRENGETAGQQNKPGGIIILDRDSFNPQFFNNLFQSSDGSQKSRSQTAYTNKNSTNTPTLAPITPYPNFNNPVSPIVEPPQQQSQSRVVADLISQEAANMKRSLYQNVAQKRKLPTAIPANPTVTSPFSPPPDMSINWPFSKRARVEDKPTPSKTALNSLLSRSIPSPKLGIPVFNSTNVNNFESSQGFFIDSQPETEINEPGTNTEFSVNNTTDIDASKVDTVNKLAEQIDVDEKERSDGATTTNMEIGIDEPNQNQTSTVLIEEGVGQPTIETVTEAITSAEKSNNMESLLRATRMSEDTELPDANLTEESGRSGVNDTTSRDNKEAPSSGGDVGIITNPGNLSQIKMIDTIKTQQASKGTNHKSVDQTTDHKQGKKSEKRTDIFSKPNPNENIKYKLSRENKTIWDLYAEWYIGINGKPSIKKLIDMYGWRRWKVTEDSHFFPTRRIIMDYIETECDRGIKLGRFNKLGQPREDTRKIIVSDLEKFRINSGLTLNSLSLYFRRLTRHNKEICIFKDFKNWNVRIMPEEEKLKYCKRKHVPTRSSHSHTSSSSIINIDPERSAKISEIPLHKGPKPPLLLNGTRGKKMNMNTANKEQSSGTVPNIVSNVEGTAEKEPASTSTTLNSEPQQDPNNASSDSNEDNSNDDEPTTNENK
ncbi:hypothetical protein KAFR_0E00910 [Kazachstania africana CBS 2517]|uniref:Transcription activator GCR1-like domain-containing protein n=1 Tax=Kazachstania africana (strain ATCC 22294 / BCRC 22015 / CBS 2517 / CECT 1963 / NBRC 1671 / NRRL Y-8276) TaxID=1071382 RepID=H2AV45_KAZAF|nr:hypothetical protein KAFR_0E00910 [Kazachstania africana CBS 2517]CCF58245.1 hypothetical protein KAFR_0E00910 [Kazachstania africana CBS 2517]